MFHLGVAFAILRHSNYQHNHRHFAPISLPMKVVSEEDRLKNIHSSSTRIWNVIHQLETHGLSTSITADCMNLHNDDVYSNHTSTSTTNITHTTSHHQRLKSLTAEVTLILREWGEKWAGCPEWQTLLNKKSLLHEVEESIIALSFLVEWLEHRQHNSSNRSSTRQLILVDVCCGKGILSMLASYLFRERSLSKVVSGIIMLDKQTDINWNHIHVSNEDAIDDGRPTIEMWSDCNLNDIDNIMDRLDEFRKTRDNEGQFALIGIHLCKLLSPSCAGLVNSLGAEKCPFVCLAPCCLPRAVLQGKKRMQSSKSIVPVRLYETVEERAARQEANSLRAGAKNRSYRDQPCYLCSETSHSVAKCGLLPSDEFEQLDIFRKAAARIPWYVS